VILRVHTGPCGFGVALVAWTDSGIAALLLGDTPGDLTALRADLRRRFPRAILTPCAGEVTIARTALAHVADPAGAPRPPLDLHGTAFQRTVWEALTHLPPGVTTPYGALAASLGRPGAARAIARAVATNPVAVAVPCHRVLGAGGDLRGYRWGLRWKAWLLGREGTPLPQRPPRPTGRSRRPRRT
jgi:AraC family transcriptional regulator of adaptative response/methylated-DNA-[protein]-cysteine methyltransferase